VSQLPVSVLPLTSIELYIAYGYFVSKKRIKGLPSLLTVSFISLKVSVRRKLLMKIELCVIYFYTEATHHFSVFVKMHLLVFSLMAAVFVAIPHAIDTFELQIIR
jgi:hypothetical protein